MKNFKINYKSLEFIREISWQEIFLTWKNGEANQLFWKEFWESRGFENWDEWRIEYVKPIEPENLQWSLYRINRPPEDVPEFYGVPAKGWIERVYGGQTTKKFKEIIDNSEISDNIKIKEIKNNFPKKTLLTGIIMKEKIILIEGMHRASAIATWDDKITFDSEVGIALACWSKKEIPIVGGNYKKVQN